MKLNRRRIFISALVLVLGLAAFFALRSFIFSRIHSEIDKRLHAVESSGIKSHYASLSFDWRRNVIEINQLLLEKDATDTASIYQEFISIGKIRAEGLNLFPLIFGDILSFDDLFLEELRIVMGQNFQLKTSSSSEQENDFTVRVARTHVALADFTYTDSLRSRKLSGIRSNLTIDGLALEFLADKPFAYQVNWLSLDLTEVQLPEELYTFRIKHARMDFAGKKFRADSIQVLPDAGKVEFGRKQGLEIDRYDALIPYIEMTGLSFSFIDSASVTAAQLDTQFYLKIFRDKRQPFVKKIKLLPVDQLRELPFSLLIDSLKIRKSYVQYEEYAEDASEAGKVHFDNLYASLYNIDNRSRSGSTRLSAQADLLGHGKTNLSVTFPLEKEKQARLAGSVVDFNIPEINTMLIPSTNIKVESGKMQKLTFGFSFNEIRSDGQIELAYEDLKLVIFKEDDGENADPEKDNLRTFMMNTFIFRTNMDEGLPEKKRTGSVSFERDIYRSIFNFWVKSLVSGIKSAYNLDKTEAKRSEKEMRDEQRQSNKEARRLKRAKKEKARG